MVHFRSRGIGLEQCIQLMKNSRNGTIWFHGEREKNTKLFFYHYLRIDLASTNIRVTNVKPGLVETHFSNVRFHGDDARAEGVYRGIQPLTGADIADVAYYAASAPAHVQVAEVLVLATHQGSGSVIHRD